MYRICLAFCILCLLLMRFATADEFDRFVTIEGKNASDISFGGLSKEWFIRSFVDKRTHKVIDQIYIDISYIGDFSFFNRASDENANDLHVSDINKHVGDCNGGCSLDEIIGVSIDQSYLIRHDTGFRIKIYAKDGQSFILPISREQVVTQLNSIKDAGGDLEKP